MILKGRGVAEFSSKGGEGVQPLTREQFVSQINKNKRGGVVWTPLPPPPPGFALEWSGEKAKNERD